MRHAIPRSQAKALKDIQQATALIRILREQRPHDLIDTWEELLDRGPSWRRKAARGLVQLPEQERAWLLEVTPSRHMDEIAGRSEEHTSELQSLMRISYAVFCLKKKKINSI